MGYLTQMAPQENASAGILERGFSDFWGRIAGPGLFRKMLPT
jgi:hypothetical protein